eukprot:scaffold1277_cov253-Pinguiococcus_pyrenoidosus.AAC.19
MAPVVLLVKQHPFVLRDDLNPVFRLRVVKQQGRQQHAESKQLERPKAAAEDARILPQGQTENNYRESRCSDHHPVDVSNLASGENLEESDDRQGKSRRIGWEPEPSARVLTVVAISGRERTATAWAKRINTPPGQAVRKFSSSSSIEMGFCPISTQRTPLSAVSCSKLQSRDSSGVRKDCSCKANGENSNANSNWYAASMEFINAGSIGLPKETIALSFRTVEPAAGSAAST